MNQNQHWREHFKDSLQGHSPSLTLEETLSKGYVLENVYLPWAQEHYQLPVLNPAFFHAHKSNSDFWQKWKNSFPWSASCLPIGEWENHLLVACLEPIVLPPELSAICVLSPYAPLKQLWDQYSPSQGKPKIPTLTTIKSIQDSNLLPDGLNASGDSLDLAVALADSVNDPSESQTIIAHEAGIDELSLAPEGIDIQAAPVKLQFPSSRKASDAPIPQDMPTSQIDSDQQTKTDLAFLELKANSLNVTKTNSEPTKKPVVVKSAATAVKTPLYLPKNATDEGINTSQQFLAQGFASEPVIHDIEQIEKTVPHIVINDPKLSWLENLRLYNVAKFDELSHQLFESLKTFFELSMVVAFNENEKSVKVLVWDQQFSDKGSSKTYSLEQPSFFRITKNTEKSYHGYPVNNEINEKFFEEWHAGDIPDHLTIVPLIVNGNIVGMLYSSGPKSSYTSQSLKFAQTKVNEWTKDVILKLMHKAA